MTTLAALAAGPPRDSGNPVGPLRDSGDQVQVRRASAADQEALRLMFDRCTPRTRYRRFHGPVKAIPERYLADALAGSAFHYALVAWHAAAPPPDRGTVDGPEAAPAASPGAAVALASCRVVGEGAAELGLVIEDAWQRRGLGTRLLRDLITYAAGAGLRVLEAQLLAEQAWIAGQLSPYGACRLRSGGNGVLTVTVRLGERPNGPPRW